MNSQEAAREIGTDAKTLRRFLRSAKSTFQAVGSGGRYEFSESEVATLKRKFGQWMTSEQESKGATKREPHTKPRVTGSSQYKRDLEVWAAEGDVVVPDVRNPRVREVVRLVDNARAARLDQMLMDAGLHLSQQHD